MKLLPLLFVLGAAASLAAQDVSPQVSGRLDSSWSWVEGGLPGDAVGVGTVNGRASFTAGTSAVKTELRVDAANLPSPSLALNRAWLKFRFPGLRVTTGLGRVAWGPGFVFAPGDLLFDSTAWAVSFGSEELRSAPAWLADLWWALGDEAFVEAAGLLDTAAVRVSAAPFGVTLEAAGAWNPSRRAGSGALSAQFHVGLDWYATVREDGSALAGAFGLWDLGEGLRLTSRQEALVRPADTAATARTYHDLTLASDGGWSLTGRALFAALERDPWTLLGEGRWSPLQNLTLYGGPGWHGLWTVRLGCSAQW